MTFKISLRGHITKEKNQGKQPSLPDVVGIDDEQYSEAQLLSAFRKVTNVSRSYSRTMI